MEALKTILALGGVAILIGLAIVIALYVLTSKWTKNVLIGLGYEHPNYAWIPVIKYMIIGFARYEGEEKTRLLFTKYEIPCIAVSLYPIVVSVISTILVKLGLSAIVSILDPVLTVFLFGTLVRDVMHKFGEEKSDASYILPALINIIGIAQMSGAANKTAAE